MSDSDYEHWPDDSDFWQPVATPMKGYDTNNGLKSHTYMPAIMPQPLMAQAYYPQPASPYMAYALPYYPASPYVAYPWATAEYPHVYAGRTKAQVDEDNAKISARQNAAKPRKVKPIAKPNEMFFVVEPNQADKTCRTFMDIEELDGEWTTAGGAWFFICDPVQKSSSSKKKSKTKWF